MTRCTCLGHETIITIRSLWSGGVCQAGPAGAEESHTGPGREHAEVTRRCDIKHMKTVSDKFDYYQWAGDGSKVMCGKNGCPGVEGELIRRGGIGGGKSFFTPEMKSMWDAALESQFVDPEMRKWAAEGGAFS